ncbi:zinc finger protein 112 [Trichonephila clavipes]|uniref:Zinc finger protein 112 n=1 Tax=Trichonephila clavipes TaxID=2585209 RepID=A0A8X6VND6_TRICX|nr:zinc finger protein 112 [Trichonephila clavipes]
MEEDLSKEALKKSRSFMCKTCGKAFSAKRKLGYHIRVHTKEKPYVCEMCKMAFSNSSNLKRHINVHNNKKPYVCEICKKSFSQRCQLKRHLLIHTNERPYVCEICCKRFSQSAHLKSHLRIHTNEKPYVCEICGNAFSERRKLKRHLYIHTKEKPYICEICKRAFSDEVLDVETTAMEESINFSHDGISKGKKSCVFFPKVNHLHSECVLAQKTSGGSSLIGSEGFSICAKSPNAGVANPNDLASHFGRTLQSRGPHIKIYIFILDLDPLQTFVGVKA